MEIHLKFEKMLLSSLANGMFHKFLWVNAMKFTALENSGNEPGKGKRCTSEHFPRKLNFHTKFRVASTETRGILLHFSVTTCQNVRSVT